ncbi:NmrA-like family domain-containing protein 1 [Cladobotryum mycophilum]|uniref:NmrA-like family domain-containing protein 1 n=1 Tax=Cladobotryum mycophilum TaxID=491253 RepID=A0ABR0SR22_9HYPO
MSQLIVVLGITGVQGSSVADTYLNGAGWKVRGVTRNPKSAAAEQWAAKGVEIVQGDLDDVSSLKKAFQGADVIFGVTDFWTIWRDPESNNKKKPDQDIVHYSYEVELQQGKNLADAAASVPGLKRYIFSSMSNATKESSGKYSKVFHMASKAEAVAYAQTLPGLAGKFSQIQAPFYFQVALNWGLPMTPKKQADGTWRVAAIGSGDKKLPFADVRQDYGPCVKAVAEAEPGVNFFAVGQYVSWVDILEAFCEVHGLKYGGYDEISYDQFVELHPGGLGHEVTQNILFANDFSYEGSDPNIIRPERVRAGQHPDQSSQVCHLNLRDLMTARARLVRLARID